jgi:hypothetical protein
MRRLLLENLEFSTSNICMCCMDWRNQGAPIKKNYISLSYRVPEMLPLYLLFMRWRGKLYVGGLLLQTLHKHVSESVPMSMSESLSVSESMFMSLSVKQRNLLT